VFTAVNKCHWCRRGHFKSTKGPSNWEKITRRCWKSLDTGNTHERNIYCDNRRL